MLVFTHYVPFQPKLIEILNVAGNGIFGLNGKLKDALLLYLVY